MLFKSFRIICSLLVPLILLIGCNQTDDSIKLTIFDEIDKIEIEGKCIYFDRISVLVNYEDKIIGIDALDRSIFILNQNFDLVKYIDLNEKSFLFRGRISGADVIDNKLYLVDNAYQIKAIDLDSEDIELIDFNKDKSLGASFLNNIKFISDSTFIASTVDRYEFDSLIVARKYSIDGTLKNIFKVSFDQLEYNDFIRNQYFDERSYVSINNKKECVYVTFKTSRICLEYNFDGQLINKYKLAVDESTYLEPHFEKEKKANYIRTICGSPLGMDNQCIYHMMSPAPRKGPIIFKYNENFEVISKYSINDGSLGHKYGFIIVGKNLYYFNNNFSSIFKSKITNK